MSEKGKSKLNQSSKSTSSKKMRRKRDISPVQPYSEFPATTSTFSGLVGKLMKYGTLKPMLSIMAVSFILISFSTIIYSSNNTYASSISISLTGNVNLNILKDNTNPTFGKSTTQTATVTSDHFTGYTLTIAGSNDTGRLVGSNDSTKYLSSITTPLTESQFNTDAHNDQWGFLPGALYNTSTSTKVMNTNYQPSPIATTPTTIDVTNSPTTGENYTLALASRISPNMSLDSYGQTFVLAATGNGYDYHIGYTDDQQTLPADQYGNTQSSTITLSNVTPTKDGWVFKGWCSTTTTSGGTACPGTTYQPGATITLDGTTGNDMNLHAIWAKGYNTFADAFAAFNKEKSGDYYQMQDMTSEICDSIVIGSPYTTADIAKNTLIDTRNSKTYLVAKYADGHCWMRENLNLSFTETEGVVDSVVAYDFSTGNTFDYTPDNATQTETDTPWAEDASDGTRSFKRDEDLCIGGTDISTSGGTGATCDANKPYERIGVLYNWAAATAQNSEAASKTTEATTSICPKGWRLPASSGDYSFSVLMGAYGLPTTNQDQGYSGQLQNPLNFNRPGYYNWSTSALDGRGTGGYFWSSVGYSSTSAHYLLFYSSYFGPQSGNNKGLGFSVRCVAV